MSEKIEFINADYFDLIQNWRFPVDIIFLSPPWGGPEYLNKEFFDLQATFPHIPSLLHLSIGVCPNIGVYLPRNTDLSQLSSFGMRGMGPIIEAEDISLNDHLKAITVYYGKLVNLEKYNIEGIYDQTEENEDSKLSDENTNNRKQLS